MTAPDLGTADGDKMLAEGRNDPAVEMALLKRELLDIEKNENADEDAFTILRTGKLKSDILIKQGLNQEIEGEKMVRDFERD